LYRGQALTLRGGTNAAPKLFTLAADPDKIIRAVRRGIRYWVPISGNHSANIGIFDRGHWSEV
jgi:hypothetical protein